jgi:transposase
MIAPPAGVRIYLACGVTDMRKGMTGLAMLVQQGLAEDPFSGRRDPPRQRGRGSCR